MQDIEFTSAHLDRMDEVDNAVFDAIKVIAEREDLEWDIGMIHEVFITAAKCLKDRGFSVRYPSILEDEDGGRELLEFY